MNFDEAYDLEAWSDADRRWRLQALGDLPPTIDPAEWVRPRWGEVVPSVPAPRPTVTPNPWRL